MSRQKRWLYTDMLFEYYDKESPLPLDIELLCDSIGADYETEKHLIESTHLYQVERQLKWIKI